MAANDIHVDHASGAEARRPALETVLRMLRDGDTLKITRLDRLSRSGLHLVTLGAELRERGVGLHVTEQALTRRRPKVPRCSGCSPSSPSFQHELILANTRDGLAAARARGSTGGRRPRLRLTVELLREGDLLGDAGDHTVQQIADLFSVPCTTVYGHLDDASKGQAPG